MPSKPRKYPYLFLQTSKRPILCPLDQYYLVSVALQSNLGICAAALTLTHSLLRSIKPAFPYFGYVTLCFTEHAFSSIKWKPYHQTHIFYENERITLHKFLKPQASQNDTQHIFVEE